MQCLQISWKLCWKYTSLISPSLLNIDTKNKYIPNDGRRWLAASIEPPSPLGTYLGSEHPLPLKQLPDSVKIVWGLQEKLLMEKLLYGLLSDQISCSSSEAWDWLPDSRVVQPQPRDESREGKTWISIALSQMGSKEKNFLDYLRLLESYNFLLSALKEIKWKEAISNPGRY